MLGKLGAWGLAASIAVLGTAFAADNANQGPLAKGAPAGVDKAISWHGNNLLWLVGGGVVVGGIALVATGNGHGVIQNCTLPGCTSPTTTSTPTTTSNPTTTTRTSTTTTTTTP